MKEKQLRNFGEKLSAFMAGQDLPMEQSIEIISFVMGELETLNNKK